MACIEDREISYKRYAYKRRSLSSLQLQIFMSNYDASTITSRYFYVMK